MREPERITPELVRAHGLTDAEYGRIVAILGRAPNWTELGIYSVMWSEHCSYKNSRPVLRRLPTEGQRILVRAGEENAGVVDIGGGWAVAFKVESHNHPSAVEPFQGAATGVGGILRDIFTMGARPIVNMNSLRFGAPDSPVVRRLVEGVVAGIAHYGNCMGIPTLGGEVCFDRCYEGNPLVNALSLGVLRHEQIQRGAACGLGNPVFYVGAATGRDGLGGASFASRELTEESDQDRPAVQVGDPFMEKLLMEACLELFATGAVVGVQDMGAAGLTCSSCETASRGGAGIVIDLDLVPKRETGMIPYEIMLSESQERMLIIAQAGREAEVEKVFGKWDLHAVRIGEVTGDGLMRVRFGGREVACIPARSLTDEAPVYQREGVPPRHLAEAAAFEPASIPVPADPASALTRLLSDPTVAAKHWVWRQYDHSVRTNTVVLPGSDAAVFRVKDAGAFLAMAMDGTGRYCFLDPRQGGRIAVAEAARNVVCAGAEPIALTNCLNFGNPMRAEVFWTFAEVVEGMAEAARRLGTPVTGGNVSFYNESPLGAIDPTPVIGMLGVFASPDHVTTQAFKRPGDSVLLVGPPDWGLAGSLYLQAVHGRKAGGAPAFDLEMEARVQRVVLDAIRGGLVRSAHDASDGGLGVALAECAISGGATRLGCEIDLGAWVREAGRWDGVLFGEGQSRVVLSCAPASVPAIEQRARAQAVPLARLGTVGGDRIRIDLGPAGAIELGVKAAWRGWWEGLELALGEKDGAGAR